MRLQLDLCVPTSLYRDLKGSQSVSVQADGRARLSLYVALPLVDLDEILLFQPGASPRVA